MTFISLLIALLLDQLRPIRARNTFQAWVVRQLSRLRERAESYSATQHRLLVIALLGLVGLASILVLKLLAWVSPLLQLLATLGVLYFILGFRQFSHWFGEIQLALANQNLSEARAKLQGWIDETDADTVAREAARSGDASAVAREAIRLALISAQRHVFGVIFWFVVMPGVSGAVVYWLSVQLLQAWRVRSEDLSAKPYLRDADATPAIAAVRAYRHIDWLPVRVTAFIFAIVGNFQDSLDMWRARASTSPDQFDDEDRILVAAGAGALGVRLSVPDGLSGADASEEYDLPQHAEPQLDEVVPDDMAYAVGMVWRAVAIWFFVVVLYTTGKVLT